MCKLKSDIVNNIHEPCKGMSSHIHTSESMVEDGNPLDIPARLSARRHPYSP